MPTPCLIDAQLSLPDHVLPCGTDAIHSFPVSAQPVPSLLPLPTPAPHPLPSVVTPSTVDITMHSVSPAIPAPPISLEARQALRQWNQAIQSLLDAPFQDGEPHIITDTPTHAAMALLESLMSELRGTPPLNLPLGTSVRDLSLVNLATKRLRFSM
jgi:hypothetical protein